MSFDINKFLGANTDAPMATRPEVVPEGEYLARVADIDSPDDIATKWIVAPRGGQTWPKLAIPFTIVDPDLLAKLGRKSIKVVSDFRLDVDDATSQPLNGPGKNVDLGRLRAALGQNTIGQPWSFNMLPGAGPVKVTVKHQQNQKDPENPFVRVTRVAPAA